MALGGRFVEGAQFERDELQALHLEPADHLAHQTAFDGVGLAENKSAVVAHERGTLLRSGFAVRIQPAVVVTVDVGGLGVTFVHEHAVAETQRLVRAERARADEVVARQR